MSVSQQELATTFSLPTLQVAKKLLGMKLSSVHRGKKTSGMIVEVEAYHGELDQASHAFSGRSARNEVMFWGPGYCYVYKIYGIHHCVNLVTETEGTGAAVLIRALEPIEGLELMHQRRGLTFKAEGNYNLLNGPGKLCQALAIDKKLQGQSLISSTKVWLEPYQAFSNNQLESSPRIGISKSKELLWRFYVRGNKWVGKKAPPWGKQER